MLNVLREHKDVVSWEYTDMNGIHLDLCTHHIYIIYDAQLVRQSQRTMNHILRATVKWELQKLLSVDFIYPIFDSQWVSPLVIVPKKNGKWHICVDYRELNKATQKYHFSFPLIDRVLESRKQYFSFLDGFNGYNQIQIALED